MLASGWALGRPSENDTIRFSEKDDLSECTGSTTSIHTSNSTAGTSPVSPSTTPAAPVSGAATQPASTVVGTSGLAAGITSICPGTPTNDVLNATGAGLGTVFAIDSLAGTGSAIGWNDGYVAGLPRIGARSSTTSGFGNNAVHRSTTPAINNVTSVSTPLHTSTMDPVSSGTVGNGQNSSSQANSESGLYVNGGNDVPPALRRNKRRIEDVAGYATVSSRQKAKHTSLFSMLSDAAVGRYSNVAFPTQSFYGYGDLPTIDHKRSNSQDKPVKQENERDQSDLSILQHQQQHQSQPTQNGTQPQGLPSNQSVALAPPTSMTQQLPPPSQLALSQFQQQQQVQIKQQERGSPTAQHTHEHTSNGQVQPKIEVTQQQQQQPQQPAFQQNNQTQYSQLSSLLHPTGQKSGPHSQVQVRGSTPGQNHQHHSHIPGGGTAEFSNTFNPPTPVSCPNGNSISVDGSSGNGAPASYFQAPARSDHQSLITSSSRLGDHFQNSQNHALYGAIPVTYPTYLSQSQSSDISSAAAAMYSQPLVDNSTDIQYHNLLDSSSYNYGYASPTPTATPVLQTHSRHLQALHGHEHHGNHQLRHHQHHHQSHHSPAEEASAPQVHHHQQQPQQQLQHVQTNNNQGSPTSNMNSGSVRVSMQVLYERAREKTSSKAPPRNNPRPVVPSQRRPWSAEEEHALMDGLDRVKGPHWSQILALFGSGGSLSEVLKDRNQVQLKDKARNLKLFFLKSGIEVPKYLQGVTGELKTRAPNQAAKREAQERRAMEEKRRAAAASAAASIGSVMNDSDRTRILTHAHHQPQQHQPLQKSQHQQQQQYTRTQNGQHAHGVQMSVHGQVGSHSQAVHPVQQVHQIQAHSQHQHQQQQQQQLSQPNHSQHAQVPLYQY